MVSVADAKEAAAILEQANQPETPDEMARKKSRKEEEKKAGKRGRK